MTAANRAGSDEVSGRRCAVCDHDVASHDRISLRYCRATQAQALPRRCICPQEG